MFSGPLAPSTSTTNIPSCAKRRGKQPRRRLRGFCVRSQKNHSGHAASSGLWRVYEGRNR